MALMRRTLIISRASSIFGSCSLIIVGLKGVMSVGAAREIEARRRNIAFVEKHGGGFFIDGRRRGD